MVTVDNLNKGNDAPYWRDSFLKVKEREDNYYHTHNVMSLCKSFLIIEGEQLSNTFHFFKQ